MRKSFSFRILNAKVESSATKSLSGFTSPSLIEVNPALHNFHVDQFDVNDFQSNIGNVTTTWKFNAFNNLRPDSIELPKDYVKLKQFEAPRKVENSPQPVVHTRVISQLLQHFKQTAEVRQYLRYYGSQGTERFAIIKISGDVLNNEQETARVAAALAFLYRIGLVPIVVHGAGLFSGRKSAHVASAAAEVAKSKIAVEEKRAKLMSAAQADMKNANAALVEALHREGVEAEPLFEDVFEAVEDSSMMESNNILSGAIGRVSAVDLDAINGAVKAGKIPVVAALGHLADVSYGNGAPLTFSTQEATMALAKVVRPLKVIWLRPEGGFHELDSGKPIHSVDLCRDVPALSPASSAALASDSSDEVVIGSASRVPVTVDPISVSSSELASIATKLDISNEDALALSHLASMYGVLADPGATVSVTAPEHLASELFTHKGEGTLVSRGERILSFNSLENVDQLRIRAIIQDAFGASLPDDYFASLSSNGRKLRAIYVSEGYRGVAIVTEEAGLPGVPYLDKFAVTTDSQGDKLGQVLWRTMVANESPLYWRSKSANRVNNWYYEQADGCYKSKTGDWTVFWRGLDDGNVMTAIDCALALKPTFDKHVYPARTGSNMGYVQPSLK